MEPLSQRTPAYKVKPIPVRTSLILARPAVVTAVQAHPKPVKAQLTPWWDSLMMLSIVLGSLSLRKDDADDKTGWGVELVVPRWFRTGLPPPGVDVFGDHGLNRRDFWFAKNNGERFDNGEDLEEPCLGPEAG